MKCEFFDSGVRTSSVAFQTAAGEGRVYKCLFNHKFEDGMSEKVTLLKSQPPDIYTFLLVTAARAAF